MALPGETEAGSAGTQPCRGIAWRAHRDDVAGRESRLSRSAQNHIGSVDPAALKIPARRAEYSLTESAPSPFHAEPEHERGGWNEIRLEMSSRRPVLGDGARRRPELEWSPCLFFVVSSQVPIYFMVRWICMIGPRSQECRIRCTGVFSAVGTRPVSAKDSTQTSVLFCATHV
jgi:hypothetical protein